MIVEIFTIIAPVLAVALVGYAWDRRGMPFDTNMVTHLVSTVATPCLLVHSFLTIRPDITTAGRVFAAAMVFLLITGLVAWAILRITKQPVNVFLPALIFPNVGNMGLPLCLFAFGEIGLAFAVVFFAGVGMVQFSIGTNIASGNFSLRGFVRNPALIAILTGAILSASDVTLPRWILNTIQVLGQLTIPLMLLSLGTALARLKVTDLRRSLGFSVLRLGLGFAAALAVCWLLDLSGPARGAVIVQASMPSAVFNYLFAARYGNRPEEVAGVVLLSTLMSFLTLPLLIAYVLRL